MHVNKVKTIAKYIHIAGKLQRTLILNYGQFPELRKLQDSILTIPIDKTQPDPFLHHLDEITQVLQRESCNYVIRHLHHFFTKDVEALKQGWELMESEYYLNTVNR